MKKKSHPKRINEVGITDDIITGRGGLALFVRYLTSINLLPFLHESFGNLRKSAKGLSVTQLFLQIFGFLFDGTSRHLRYFDTLAQDKGYAAAIETDMNDMASSHTIKRFFALFTWCHGGLFRKILNQLFVWRLKLSRPGVVELAIDTMVMDNDEALIRHGVQPTYKKKKGFQPLHMIWNSMIVDAVFRGGKKHSNYGNTVINMIQRMVPLIRSTCGVNVLIIIRMDSGFLDEKILAVLDELAVGFIVSGKMYPKLKDAVASQPPEAWGHYDHERQSWEYLEFDWGCASWEYTYRTLYTRPIYDNGQGLLTFARPDNIIITNLDCDSPVWAHSTQAQREHWLKPATIIESHHGRGADELPHRGLKDFGFEQLPFKRFGPNSALYYCMLIGFLLFESFKQDVSKDVIAVTSYATTVRRKLIDIAAKIVTTGNKIILKVSRAVMDTLQFETLWKFCNNPTPISI